MAGREGSGQGHAQQTHYDDEDYYGDTRAHGGGHAHAHRECGREHDHNENQEEQEREHFQTVVAAFNFYRTDMLRRIAKAEQDFATFSARHQDMVPNFRTHIEELRRAVEGNYDLIKAIISPHQLFQNQETMDTANEIVLANESVCESSQFNMDKVRSTLKQFVRDWSDEGALERLICYQPMIDDLVARYAPEDRAGIQVLVPGCGLGRLAYEFAQLGFSCQGNECSYFMLIASNFILNRTGGQQLTIHPWVHQFSNNLTKCDQARPIKIPDVNPATTLPDDANFSMTAGDFLDCYKTPESWDAVCTCFFLDTARNLIDYIETIYSILTPGGVWTNFGPLLFHYADMEDASLEISFEEVRDIMLQVGFQIQTEKTGIPCGYIHNTRSMYNIMYSCVYFVAVKPDQ